MVTHIPVRETGQFSRSLENWIGGQLEAVQRVSRTNANVALLRDLVLKRTSGIKKQLKDLKSRLEETLDVTATGRKKRGLVDGVGAGLQWLFGVSTTADFDRLELKLEGLTKDRDDLTHLVQHQASVVNETLWEVRETAQILGNLSANYDSFGKQVRALLSAANTTLSKDREVMHTYVSLTEVYNDIETELKTWDEEIFDRGVADSLGK